jgi:hypothetical protein
VVAISGPFLATLTETARPPDVSRNCWCRETVPAKPKRWRAAQGIQAVDTMVKIVDFVVVLDDGVRKRHHHKTEKRRVTDFAVQLEVKYQDEWKVVIRYDCAHGLSHVDQYDIIGLKTKRALNLAFDSALAFGEWDNNENWRNYRNAFLRGTQ